jgi:hypothetical protein
VYLFLEDIWCFVMKIVDRVIAVADPVAVGLFFMVCRYLCFATGCGSPFTMLLIGVLVTAAVAYLRTFGTLPLSPAEGYLRALAKEIG